MKSEKVLLQLPASNHDTKSCDVPSLSEYDKAFIRIREQGSR